MAYFYPNRMGRIIFFAFEEVLGRSGINAILNHAGISEFIDQYPPNDQTLAFSFESISHMLAALDDFYGPRGGHGVALRIGRACFQHGLREFGPLAGFTELPFRLMPLKAKLKIGASSFADIFNKYSDQRVRLEDKGDVLLWHIDVCPLCWQRHSDTMICQMAVGLLQEALYWVSGGKYFNVEEIHCISSGDPACTIVINKTPMS
jgi:predicted hydrocarbon binding protein